VILIVGAVGMPLTNRNETPSLAEPPHTRKFEALCLGQSQSSLAVAGQPRAEWGESPMAPHPTTRRRLHLPAPRSSMSSCYAVGFAEH
jgi:hypothetical protein